MYKDVESRLRNHACFKVEIANGDFACKEAETRLSEAWYSGLSG